MSDKTINIPFVLLMNDGSKIFQDMEIDRDSWLRISGFEKSCIDDVASRKEGCLGFVQHSNKDYVFFKDGQWWRKLYIYMSNGTVKEDVILGYDSYDYTSKYIRTNRVSDFDLYSYAPIHIEGGLEYVKGKWMNPTFREYLKKLF